MSKTLFINDHEVRALITPKMAIEAAKAGMKEYGIRKATNMPRSKIILEDGLFRAMMASIPSLDVVGIKQGMWLSSEAKGKTNEVERRTELVTLFSISEGRILAVINSPTLNQLRTAAGSGLATEYLSREDSSSVGVIGTGPHALSQLEAVAAVRHVKNIYVYSRSEENRLKFVEKAESVLSASVEAVNTSTKAVKQSDIIIEATYSRTPVFNGEDVLEGTHINSIGSSFAGKQVIPDSLFSKLSLYVVDFKEQAIYDGSGDILNPIAHGFLEYNSILDLGEIVAERHKGRINVTDITLYKSLGMGLLDVSVAKSVYDEALIKGVGLEIPVLR